MAPLSRSHLPQAILPQAILLVSMLLVSAGQSILFATLPPAGARSACQTGRSA